MERRNFLGALAAGSLGAALPGPFARLARAQNATQGGAGAPARSAQSSEFPEGSTIVLVHAAWADGSCWGNIIAPLERRGLKVICAPIPLTSLRNDAAALNWALERTSGPVILVGHAYSGAVIAAVREERIKSLVYIAALAPDEGETVAKVFYRDTPSPEQPKMVSDAHGYVWMPDDAFRRALAHKATADQASDRGCRATPHLGEVYSGDSANATLEIETVVVLSRRGRPHDQSEDAAFHGGAHEREDSVVYRVDHTPMYSQPALVSEIILEAARGSFSQ